MSDKDATSTALVERWRQGDEDAATELHERYFQRLRRKVAGHLAKKYQGKVEAEDVAHSALRTWFLRVRRDEFHFEDDENVWTLLVTLALHKAYNLIRKANAAKRIPATNAVQLAEDLCCEPSNVAAQEAAELLESLFEELPLAEQRMLELRLDGYTQAEIAAKLKVTTRTVRRKWDGIREVLSKLAQLQHRS